MDGQEVVNWSSLKIHYIVGLIQLDDGNGSEQVVEQKPMTQYDWRTIIGDNKWNELKNDSEEIGAPFTADLLAKLIDFNDKWLDTDYEQ